MAATRYRSRKPASEEEGGGEEMEDLYENTEIEPETDVAGPDASAGMTRSESIAAGKAMAASKGNPSDAIGSGLMASGNPYAMGAGAGLMVLSAQQKRRDAEAQAAWQEKQARIERQQAAVSKLIGVSNSLRNL